MLDATINALTGRFEQLQAYVDNFDFLSDFTIIKTISKSDLGKYCLEIERKLTNNNDETWKKDVIRLQLYDKIETVLNFIETPEIYSPEHV